MKDLLKFELLKTKHQKENTYTDFSRIFKSSFKQDYSLSTFCWKYLDNFSNESMIQEISYNNIVVGYRGLWKINNYSQGYQCIDTCIDRKHQGKGIFKLSNKNLTKDIGCFYNYPNKLSRPGYLKSGWVEASKMNIYINRLENFEYCNWNEDFLDWRFVKHPYIKYYKTKIEDGYAIIRFKKNLPIHIESIKNNIELEEIRNPILSFKYDLKNNGMKVKNAGSVLTYNFNGNLRSTYFDMI